MVSDTSANNIIPTMGNQVALKLPKDKIAYILRSYATTPKSISTTYYDMIISLEDVISRYANDKENMVQPIIDDLAPVLRRVFPDAAAINIGVSTPDSADQVGAYDVKISVSVVVGGVAYAMDSTTPVVDGRIKIPNDTVEGM